MVDVPYKGYIYPESKKFISGSENIGIYGFVATGSYYLYYNGDRWLPEYREYKQQNGELWKNSGVDFLHNHDKEFVENWNNYLYDIKLDPSGYEMRLVCGTNSNERVCGEKCNLVVYDDKQII